jgi:hypothetical protein
MCIFKHNSFIILHISSMERMIDIYLMLKSMYGFIYSYILNQNQKPNQQTQIKINLFLPEKVHQALIPHFRICCFS